MSNQGIHFNHDLDIRVKKDMEEKWLEVYGKTIDNFRDRYGKNYL